MPRFSHVRMFRLWDFERYTDAQATELRQLRDLYTTHLVPVFGPDMPDAFALVTEGNFYYPRYTATTLTPLPMTPVPPTALLPT